jgi:hypothetical protein
MPDQHDLWRIHVTRTQHRNGIERRPPLEATVGVKGYHDRLPRSASVGCGVGAPLEETLQAPDGDLDS